MLNTLPDLREEVRKMCCVVSSLNPNPRITLPLNVALAKKKKKKMERCLNVFKVAHLSELQRSLSTPL